MTCTTHDTHICVYILCMCVYMWPHIHVCHVCYRMVEIFQFFLKVPNFFFETCATPTHFHILFARITYTMLTQKVVGNILWWFEWMLKSEKNSLCFIFGNKVRKPVIIKFHLIGFFPY